jgi:biotin carboxyl carrier protein
MYQIKINDKYSFDAVRNGEDLVINNNSAIADIKHIGGGVYHLIEGNQSYNADVVSFNSAEKTAQIKINNNTYTITAKDQFDILLDKLGLSSLTSTQLNEIKAPMPGLVLKVFATDGDKVKKGDNLLILEAMKMENIIKCPADVTIKRIRVKSGDKVEKGQILIEL